ncbi:AAA family ATPase [Okeanomitos corallinicola TIOX110]|uniref:AAA family ATPase n=1 Tax=Okeanomitos corallinicola TIOX110 TaxID=3133117 RepID=A0ABZ2USM1_9CYAN
MLQRLKLNGFKSIKNMDLELRPLNILIGANGAGKSNLISFFKMLNEMMSDRLQQYIAISGYAQSLLHFGPKVTPQIEAQLEFEFRGAAYKYHFNLLHAAGDTLIFGEENLSAKGLENNSRLLSLFNSLGSGHQESKMIDGVAEGLQTAIPLNYLLDQFRVYHFHDTSSTSAIRQSCYVGYNKLLMSDGGNVAALLLRLREDNNIAYQRIIKTIRLIAPFFDDFVLEPRGNNVILNWREKGSEQVFGPHQFSDGTLRAICLITLLLQPEEQILKLIIVDEPELGLHPYALNIIAAIFGKASYHTQILISTQSTAFLDNFNPEDVITVDRVDKESIFKRLNAEELEAWLEEYSLGEIWEKNIIGGGPH